MGITNKQQIFISEYMKDFNATQAAIRAGYSAKSARSDGNRLLTNADISEEIKRQISERIMGEEEVKTRLADIARGDIADLMEIYSTGFNFKLIEEDENGNRVINPKTKLIKKIKQKTTIIQPRNQTGDDREIVETEIELYSALEAIEFIAKLNGMITEKKDITSDGKPLSWSDFIKGAGDADQK